jgi:FeS assembly SUF system protein
MDEGKTMDQIEPVAGTGQAAKPVEAPTEAPAGEATQTVISGSADEELKTRVVEAISQVYDPEIPVNIYELGLIYKLEVDRDGMVGIDMTLTSPACPVAGSLPGDVETRVREVEGVNDVRIELVWEPAWSPEKMTEAARLELGMM